MGNIRRRNARALLTTLCESQLPTNDLVRECATLLGKSPIHAARLLTVTNIDHAGVDIVL